MLKCHEMQALEEKAFAAGATPEQLMEKVGLRMARLILEDVLQPGTVMVFLGKGHNAGDALVVARHLQGAGWTVRIRQGYPAAEMAELSQRKLSELKEQPEPVLRPGPLLLLDGLVGIGASGKLRSPLGELADEMNSLRTSHGAETIAMDLPSGLNADVGSGGHVIADQTLTVGVPKRGLVADTATPFVGRLSLIPVEELPLPKKTDSLTTGQSVNELLPPRAFGYHKGQAGRVSIVAGSPGMWGAAVLCAQGALRGGAGMVTLYAKSEAAPILQPLLDPEVMLKTLPEDWSTIGGDAIVIGPGLGTSKSSREMLFKVLTERKCPVVLDADGLNLIAAAGRFDCLGKGVLLTPHPGEMARLNSSHGTRAERVRALAEQSGSTVLFKGSRTIVTEPGAKLHYNTTGHPAMATGGQGDTLSGVLGALLAGGLSPLEAGRVGAWACGRAAEIALSEGESEQSLTPTRISEYLGKAFRSARIRSRLCLEND
ncbi:NAD(P)H-hydrate dehydratase [Roseibacillus persicicus]|uniref:NAD(P)H-hydrate dehydratase n=1 Tax=Roseibacillus persicicus TaxID=454148 RepID=UPI00398AE8A8